MKKRFLALVLALALAVPVPAALAAEPEEDGSVPAAGEPLEAASEELEEVLEERPETLAVTALEEALEPVPEEGPVAAADGETPVRGSCGENAQWYFDADAGHLRISGTGAVEDYSTSTSAPWYSYRDSIRTVSVEGGITRLGNRAFFRCVALTGVSLPGSLEEVGENAFRECTALTSVTLPDSVTVLGGAAFQGCSSLERAVLSDGLTELLSSTFNGCKALEAISIPDGVTRIEGSAFLNSGLREVSLPEGLLELGGFMGCADLKQIEIPQSVTAIKSSAFSGSGLTSVIIPGGVRTIESEAFRDCESLRSAVLEEGISAVGQNMFFSCGSLRYVTLPDSVTRIGNNAFGLCTSLEEIVLPEGLTAIESNAFNAAGLTSVTVPGTVKGALGARSFYNCPNLTAVTVGSGVTLLPSESFAKCPSLTSAAIPRSVRTISLKAFTDCPNLRHVYYEGMEAEWNSIFDGNGGKLSDGPAWLENVTVHYENSQLPAGSPRILALSPASGGVSPGTVLDVTFDREIAERPGNRNSPLVLPDNGFQIVRLSDGQAVYTAGDFSWPQFTYGASRSVLRISPNNIRSRLTPGEEYAVVLGEGFVSFADGTVSPELPSGGWTFTASQPPDAVRVSDTAARYEGAVELSDGTCVLAAAYSRGGGPMTAASQGAFSASDGMIAFDSSVRQGDRLFLLEPGTYIPLAKPILLE